MRSAIASARCVSDLDSTRSRLPTLDARRRNAQCRRRMVRAQRLLRDIEGLHRCVLRLLESALEPQLKAKKAQRFRVPPGWSGVQDEASIVTASRIKAPALPYSPFRWNAHPSASNDCATGNEFRPIGSASKFEALLEHGQGFVDAIVSNQRHAEPLKDIGQQRSLVAGWPCGRLPETRC